MNTHSDSPTLALALAAWGTPGFGPTLKAELEALTPDELALDEWASPGAFASQDPFKTLILEERDTGSEIVVRAGIFFTQVTPSYCCGEEEPMTADVYAEIEVAISKSSGKARFGAPKKDRT